MTHYSPLSHYSTNYQSQSSLHYIQFNFQLSHNSEDFQLSHNSVDDSLLTIFHITLPVTNHNHHYIHFNFQLSHNSEDFQLSHNSEDDSLLTIFNITLPETNHNHHYIHFNFQLSHNSEDFQLSHNSEDDSLLTIFNITLPATNHNHHYIHFNFQLSHNSEDDFHSGCWNSHQLPLTVLPKLISPKPSNSIQRWENLPEWRACACFQKWKQSHKKWMSQNLLEPQSLKFSTFEDWVLRIMIQGTVNLQGVKLTFFPGSHLAPKYFKVVANSKK